MHLEYNILKGKFGKNKELKKEAKEELHEMKGEMKHKMKAKKVHHAIRGLVKKSGKSSEETSRLAHFAFDPTLKRVHGEKRYEKDEPEMGGKLK